MDEAQKKLLLDLYMKEYEKIKSEQIQRLGFRDNLIYVTLAALTGVLSIVVGGTDRAPVLLVLPMICLVLGWTYLVNDEKISAIGRYVRTTFSERMQALVGSKDPELFGWEVAHRSDPRRKTRKIFQLIVDEFVFVLSGAVAIVMFWLKTADMATFWWIVASEIILLLVLGIQIFIYADLKKGK
jgi:hypothetical protein